MMNHARRCLFLLLLTAGALTGCAGNPNGVRPVIGIDGTVMNVQDPIENGRALVMTGQYGLAIEALSRVLLDEPKNVRALNLIAESYARLHRYDLADRYHGEALAIDPNSVAALNNWAYSLLVRGDRARATDLLHQAAAVAGDQPVVTANLRLAAGEAQDGAATEPSESVVATPQEVPLGEHVVILRRSGKVVRLAPGVQLLVTDASAPGAAQPVSTAALPTASAVTAPLPYIAHQSAADDQRALVFAALQQLLEPSPFGFFPEVDDFSQLSPQGPMMARTPGPSTILVGQLSLKPSPFGFFPEVDDFRQVSPESRVVARTPGPLAVLVGQVSG
jgi:hypothetical protein